MSSSSTVRVLQSAFNASPVPVASSVGGARDIIETYARRWPLVSLQRWIQRFCLLARDPVLDICRIAS
jgi:hypothetical protein